MRDVPHLFIAIVLVSALAGCGEEQKQKVEDAGRSVGAGTAKTWTKLRDFTAEQKAEAVVLWDKGMGHMKARLETARTKGGDWSEDAKKALGEKWTKVELAYAKAKEASGEGWNTAHDAFVAAYLAFQEELKKHE